MLTKKNSVSKRTAQRWLLVVLLTILGLAVFLSSVYFLFFPLGYQGGRNPYFNITVIFDRETWDELHLWSGLAMIFVLAIHILVHWDWIKVMVARFLGPNARAFAKSNKRMQFNILLNVVAAISFVLVSLSGIYLMFTPGRSSASTTPSFIFNWYAWDVIHTWSGVVMFISVFLHFYIHWTWITKVSRRVLAGRKSNANQLVQGEYNV